MHIYLNRRRKDTLNTISRTTKTFTLIFCFSFFSNFTNLSCRPEPLDEETLTLAFLYSYFIDQERKNSFEPNNTKETAYCLDDTYKDPSSLASISSTIYPREDIDYFKVSFRNQKISLSHFTSHSKSFHILLESDSAILYDSRNPEAANVFIESNQLVQIPIDGETYEARTILIKDLNFVFLKLLHNESASFPSSGRSYPIFLKNDSPSITDTSNFDFFRLTGEFQPCPK
jgi:hypothetical protein